MRTVSAFCLVLLLSCFAAGQATVINGYASTWAPSYGVYLAAPYAPLLSTPSIQLTSVAPNTVGASNTAFGLSAGATNSTLSIAGQVPVSEYTQPVWYNSTTPFPMQAAAAEPSQLPRREAAAGGFEMGLYSEGPSVASRMPKAGEIRKASRTYTNQDADHMNDTNGHVKWDDRTEVLPSVSE